MATNPYFSSQTVAFTQDQTLFNNLIVEAIQAKGIDYFYLPRTLKNFDSFFGEDQASAFNDAIAVEMYQETVQTWGDEGSFISKFGLEIRDSARVSVSQSRFEELVTSVHPEIRRPREGDIIAFPNPVDNRMRFFEITFVDNESTFYQIGRLYTYTMTVKTFEYTGESFATGMEEFDSFDTKYSLSSTYMLEPGVGVFSVGETVFQDDFSGEVISANDQEVVLIKIKGFIDYTADLVGQSSGVQRFVSNQDEKITQDSMLNDVEYLHDRGNQILDFSEANPFSGG